MTRAIDGDALLDEFKKEIAILKETPGKDDYDKGIIQGYKEAITHLKVSPTHTPPNEPEYREYTCPNCHHTWLEDRDASDYPEYCPRCGDPLHKEENEPLTLEQLRESPHGKIKDSTLQSICNRANEIASRPPEGEEES